MKLAVVADCSCQRERPLADGGLPEYYDDEGEAAAAFMAHRARERELGQVLIYAVHVDGLHVVAVDW